MAGAMSAFLAAKPLLSSIQGYKDDKDFKKLAAVVLCAAAVGTTLLKTMAVIIVFRVLKIDSHWSISVLGLLSALFNLGIAANALWTKQTWIESTDPQGMDVNVKASHEEEEVAIKIAYMVPAIVLGIIPFFLSKYSESQGEAADVCKLFSKR